jgi:hypothetical protein
MFDVRSSPVSISINLAAFQANGDLIGCVDLFHQGLQDIDIRY